MISFPLIDTHLHVWDLDRLAYPWLDQVPEIKKTFLLDDFDCARDGLAVDGLVFVQCECRLEQHLDELAWVQSLAEGDPRLKGIVPWAPLEQGEAVGAELHRMAEDKRVKGIRRIIQFEADPRFCVQPAFVRGVQLCAEAGLHFELTISPAQMPAVLELVRAAPGTQFMLDHIGNPDIAGGAMEPWHSGIRELAALDNVWCKVSGLATNADLAHWRREQFMPYLEAVVEAFGTERIVYAGDWPHALRAIEYVDWVNVLDWATGDWADADRRKLFRENAIRFYRLPA
ncbi:MAG: amidohydrolase family protein [Dehalococcoidia bacterium]